MIYDADLNITWLQDAIYAHTSCYDLVIHIGVIDNGGLLSWYEEVAWADQLVYGGMIIGDCLRLLIRILVLQFFEKQLEQAKTALEKRAAV